MPALIWGMIILLIISLPNSAHPPTEKLRIPHFDKIVHFLMYAVFGALILLGYGKFDRNAITTAKQLIVSVSLGIAYGTVTEFLQHFYFTYRDGNIYDVIANGFGTVFGVLIVVALQKTKKFRN